MPSLLAPPNNKHTSNTANAVHDIVNHLLADGVVTTGVVVGSILLAADQHLRVEELAVATGADLIDGRRVEVDEKRTGDVLATAGLGEEGLERARVANVRGVGVWATIVAEAVLQKVAIGEVVSKVGPCLQGGRIGRTAPRQSYQAGYQPGPGGGEESGRKNQAVSDQFGS